MLPELYDKLPMLRKCSFDSLVAISALNQKPEDPIISGNFLFLSSSIVVFLKLKVFFNSPRSYTLYNI